MKRPTSKGRLWTLRQTPRTLTPPEDWRKQPPPGATCANHRNAGDTEAAEAAATDATRTGRLYSGAGQPTRAPGGAIGTALTDKGQWVR